MYALFGCMQLRGQGPPITGNSGLQGDEAETDAEKAEVARRERERLRLQAKLKKEQLEKVRDQQNQDTAIGEVFSLCLPAISCMTFADVLSRVIRCWLAC